MTKRQPQKKREPIPAPCLQQEALLSTEGWIDSALFCFAGGLFFSRLFLSAELSAEGDLLWIDAIWFGLLAVWGIRSWWNQSSFFCWTKIDTAVAFLVLGHLVSASVVLLTEGHKRAAINYFWEWWGVLAAWLLLRMMWKASHRKKSDHSNFSVDECCSVFFRGVSILC